MDSILLKIKDLQERNNLTVKDFADRLDVTKQTIYDYYNEKSQISIKNLKKIADVFGVPMSYFFEETGTAPAGVLKTAPQTADFQKQIIALQAEVSALKSKIIELQDKIINK